MWWLAPLPLAGPDADPGAHGLLTAGHAHVRTLFQAARVCCWAACGTPLAGPADEHKKCSRCKQQFYCSKDCQKMHWKRGHKKVCVEPPLCTICLDGGIEPVPIQRGCGCRGDAGLAHVACIAEMNHQKRLGHHNGWHNCDTCGQRYTAAMQLGLAREVVKRNKNR